MSGATGATPPKKKRSGALMALVLVGGCLGVVFVGGVLAAIAIPSFVSYTRRSKTAEAQMYVQELKARVMEHCAANGALPPAAGPVPAAPGELKQIGDFASDPVFAQLGFAPPDPLYFSYAIRPRPGAVVVVAEGDLDADGSRSRFESTCTASPCSCSPVAVTDELE